MRRRSIIWTTFFLIAVSATQISPSPYGDENDGEGVVPALPMPAIADDPAGDLTIPVTREIKI